MTELKNSLMFFFVFALFSVSTLAQEVVAASGGEASGTAGSASYTVGQIFYATYEATTGSVVEGVQQPFEISVSTGIENIPGMDLKLSAFPNPTTDYLTLKVDAQLLDEANAWYCHLYDMKGLLLLNKRLVATQTIIDMAKFQSGSYLLQVVRVNNSGVQQKVGVFKVIKY
ncbi:T9SS type A sorting domain-containing protein [Saccharicrinis sp. 156]|uniref:T9SS type A sorting domain-containing protein n=1 Tax=Saccharicrinis sp. 156 TaxID=3417574 RepID=UPI003D339585